MLSLKCIDVPKILVWTQYIIIIRLVAKLYISRFILTVKLGNGLSTILNWGPGNMTVDLLG